MLRNWQPGRKSLNLFTALDCSFYTLNKPCFTPYEPVIGREGGSEERKMFCRKQQTTIKHICSVPTPKVHLSTCILSLGLPALGQPVSHIQNQVTVLVLKVDAGPLCCCEARALTHVCLWCVYPSSCLGLCLPTLAVYMCVSSLHHLLSFNENPVCVFPPNIPFSPLPQTRWTFPSDTYFNLFLLPAPSLLSASLLSPHGQVSCNFYSLIPPALPLSPLHLLPSLPFSSLP